MKSKNKGYRIAEKKKPHPINIFTASVAALSALCAVLHFFLFKDADFADRFNSTVGRAVRIVLAKITEPLPFSLAEFFLFASPLLLVILCTAVALMSKKGPVYAVRSVTSVAAAAALVWCLFTLDFAAGYRGKSLAEKLGLEDRAVSAEELYDTSVIIIGELNSLCKDIGYTADGSGPMPFSYKEMSEELCLAYDGVCEEYDFIDNYNTKVKPLVVSKYMTYTHISGIYSFFTGEANLNTNFPDYVCVYTAAHEMAHQRGVSREDEANFIAFLVCKNSENAYVRYCAYLNMYEYLADALYKASPELYAKAYSSLSLNAKGELRAYSNFFEKYRSSRASEVSDTLNNAYLESQGTEGVASYGMVADLAVAYYLH